MCVCVCVDVYTMCTYFLYIHVYIFFVGGIGIGIGIVAIVEQHALKARNMTRGLHYKTFLPQCNKLACLSPSYTLLPRPGNQS
jgi:hypothetical protein